MRMTPHMAERRLSLLPLVVAVAALVSCANGVNSPACEIIGELPISDVSSSPSVPNVGEICAGQFVSPVASSTSIKDTFGPRWTGQKDNFFRGIMYTDEPGTPVYAVASGKVFRRQKWPSGKVLVLEINLKAGGATFHGEPINKVYVYYTNLESASVKKNEKITAGQQIGTMSSKLVVEMRLVGYCPLSNQGSYLQHHGSDPNSNCYTGFDPHVHPFLFIGGLRSGPKRLYEVEPIDGKQFAVRYEVTRGHLDLDVIDSNFGTIGFNMRDSIDATSQEALDVLTYFQGTPGETVLRPCNFNEMLETVYYEVHFATRPASLEFRDIYGHGIRWVPEAAPESPRRLISDVSRLLGFQLDMWGKYLFQLADDFAHMGQSEKVSDAHVQPLPNVAPTPKMKFLAPASAVVSHPAPLTTVAVTKPPSLPNFAAMSQDDYQSPVPHPMDLASSFGQVLKTPDGFKHFQTGLDITGKSGTPVFSMAAGMVRQVIFESLGGTTVVIESAVKGSGFAFHNRSITKVFAKYKSLETVHVSENDVVAKGQQIGTMGKVGTTDLVHFHFETWLQGSCSLGFQSHKHHESNINSDCLTGFDPSVHPLLFIGGERHGQKTLHEIQPLKGFEFAVQYKTSLAHLDVIETDLGTVGFNWREGMASMTAESSDDIVRVADYMSLAPQKPASSSTEVSYDLHFKTRPAYIELRDIYGDGIRWSA